jgi:hypothetical protein
VACEPPPKVAGGGSPPSPAHGGGRAPPRQPLGWLAGHPRAGGGVRATPSGGRVKRGHLCGSRGGRAPPLDRSGVARATPRSDLGVARGHPGCHRRGHHLGWLERHPQPWGGRAATPVATEVARTPRGHHWGGPKPPQRWPGAREPPQRWPGMAEPPPATFGGGSQATPSPQGVAANWQPPLFFFFFFFLKKINF